jgi:hypothetical protein
VRRLNGHGSNLPIRFTTALRERIDHGTLHRNIQFHWRMPLPLFSHPPSHRIPGVQSMRFDDPSSSSQASDQCPRHPPATTAHIPK